MASALGTLLKIVAPKRLSPAGISYTNTFQPSNTDQVLSAPVYREHLDDIFSSRSVQDSRTLLKNLFIHDTDVSAAVNAHLTAANTEPIISVRDENGMFDRVGLQEVNAIIAAMTQRFDYSKGFVRKQSLLEIAENMRYLTLLRGGFGAELIVDKQQVPTAVRLVDLATITWFEREPGMYVPQQEPPGASENILLDIPSFFVGFHRRDPTAIYTNSPFVSAINTIAARQQVINDLYRIMQLTGFPRLEITVLEDVLLRNAPATVQMDATAKDTYVREQMTAIRNAITGIRPDQAFVHTNSVEAKLLNEKAPGATLNIDSIINTLNAQNQAGLRAMATVLGRGESGVNTASVEAQLFSRTAEELNTPVADVMSRMLTLALRLRGGTGYVEVKFRPVELRPATELEPQLLARASRLKEDLSLGIITDDEYHLWMYGRMRPDSAPELSGTGFMQQGSVGVDVEAVSPNSDPLGRSITGDSPQAKRDNRVK